MQLHGPLREREEGGREGGREGEGERGEDESQLYTCIAELQWNPGCISDS